METIEISNIEVHTLETEDQVLIHGPLEFRNCQLLCDLAFRSLENGNSVTLDMSEVRFVDSEGMGSLIQLIKHARRLAVPLHLKGLSSLVIKLLRITGLMKFFTADTEGRLSVRLGSMQEHD